MDGRTQVGTTGAAWDTPGCCPNYSLAEATTQMETTRYWTKEAEPEAEEPGEAPGEKTRKTYRSEVRDYERSRWLPSPNSPPPSGSSIYVNDYRRPVRAVDIGSPERRAWSVRRLCPACGYVCTENAATDTAPCPRYNGRKIADAGCAQHVLRPGD